MTFSDPRTFDTANPLQGGLRRLGATAPGSKVFRRVLHHIDKPVARITRGKHTAASLLAGMPIVMLTTTRAKSGKRYLRYVPQPDAAALLTAAVPAEACPAGRRFESWRGRRELARTGDSRRCGQVAALTSCSGRPPSCRRGA